MVAAVGARAGQVRVFAVANYPAEGVRASQTLIRAAVDGPTDVRVSQTRVFALAQGRRSNPKIRPWTFTLDGHDFYVVNLGTVETLVCDLTTGEWYTFGSGESDLWRVSTGINWPGAGTLLGLNGSDVLVGDDTTGTLYFLGPDKDKDDDPLLGDAKQTTFQRRVTTQHLISEGYSWEPCFGVQLMASVGEAADDDLTVTLEYSDDRGHTWVNAGDKEVDSAAYYTRLNWMSLGGMQAPGRLFRLTDTQALKRVDSFDLETGEQ